MSSISFQYCVQHASVFILSLYFLFTSGKMASSDSNLNEEIMEKVHISVKDLFS